ncbi:hypothetical protein D3C76_1078670 [compost metagenome]
MLALGSTRSLMIFCAVSASGGISMVSSRRFWMRRAVKAWTALVISRVSSSGRSRLGLMASTSWPKLLALALASMRLKCARSISSSRPASPDWINTVSASSRLFSYWHGELVSAGMPGRALSWCFSSICFRRGTDTAVSLRPVSSARRLRSSSWLCGNSTIRAPTSSSSSTACTRDAAGRCGCSTTSR